MFRSRFPRRPSARLPLLAGVLSMTLLPMQTSTTTVRADVQSHQQDQPSHGQKDKPDPCDRIAEMRREPKGLLKRCAEFGGGSGIARADFNGDGIGDLAIGVPYENVGSAPNAGAVHIIYGSATGLTSTGNQFFTQDSPGVPGAAERDDHFGRTLAAVDLNDDGFSDLAVGIPEEDAVEGRVQMLMGSSSGLVATETAFTFNSLENSTCGCIFGSALAWGDFDDDGKGDLAIGMRAYEVSDVQAGGVLVRFGDGTHSIIPASHTDSNATFGMALAAGDYDGDGHDDLAVGVPGQTLYDAFSLPHDWAGAVYLYRGTNSGLTENWEFFAQDDAGGTWEAGDQFGRSLAFGDFDDDGRDELVVGAPYEKVGTSNDAGAVSIFYDIQIFPTRLNRTYTQNDLSGADAQASDMFGRAVATGDFDGDGRADLAIGAPGEDIGNPFFPLTFFQNAGIVHVLYGYANMGLPPNGRSEIWHQDKSGVPGAVETGDMFGYALSAWNFGKTSHRDLAIGLPYEDINGTEDAGAIVVLYGTGSGLTGSGSQIWHQDSPGILNAASTSDRFGASMY